MSLEPYRATRPAPRSIRSWPAILWATVKRFRYFLAHALRAYEARPTAPSSLSQQSPAGTISANHLRMCERLASQAAERLTRVEQKATTLLSMIALLAPLTASAAVFIVRNPPAPGMRPWILGVEIAAFLFLLLASITVMRALAVREHEDIGVGGLIDQGAIRTYSEDFEGRGLLYVAAMRDAIADHVADFVRAAQLFLWVGIMAHVLAGAFILSLARDKPSQVDATVSLAPTTMQAFIDAQREHDRARLDSLAQELVRTQRALDKVTARLGALARPGPQSGGRTPRK